MDPFEFPRLRIEENRALLGYGVVTTLSPLLRTPVNVRSRHKVVVCPSMQATNVEARPKSRDTDRSKRERRLERDSLMPVPNIP